MPSCAASATGSSGCGCELAHQVHNPRDGAAQGEAVGGLPCEDAEFGGDREAEGTAQRRRLKQANEVRRAAPSAGELLFVHHVNRARLGTSGLDNAEDLRGLNVPDIARQVRDGVQRSSDGSSPRWF